MKFLNNNENSVNKMENENNKQSAVKRKRNIIGEQNSKSSKKVKIRDISTEEYSSIANHKECKTKCKIEDQKNGTADLEESKASNTNSEELSVELLRSSLQSNNDIDMLKKFIRICKENKERDMAMEYLLAGGNILEILKLLDSAEKKSLSFTAAVFSAVNILLMKILTQHAEYLPAAEEASRYLLNTYLSAMHFCMKEPRRCKVVFQMLTAMVALGGSLPCEILVHLSLERYILAPIIDNPKLKDRQGRTSFIHFIISFLLDGDVSVIKSILEKRILLTIVFPGLIYDSHEIVRLLLVSMKKYILEQPEISKTSKLHVFSTRVTQTLVSLYNWKGPKHLKNTHNEEKQLVNDTVHEFLITLLTSHRYGVVFHDPMLGTSHIKRNQLVYTVLQSLDKPWEHEKPSDLVIKILIACPDLIKWQFGQLEQFLEPRVSLKWIILMQFTKKIIESINIETCVKLGLSELNTSQLTNAMLSLIIPTSIIKNGIQMSVTHDNIAVRHKGVTLLLSMIYQAQKFIAYIKLTCEDIDMALFRINVKKHILQNLPKLDLILKVWNLALCTHSSISSDSVVEPSKHDHLDAILNLLHAYNDVCPELLDSEIDVQPSVLLTGLNSLNIEDDILKILKVKAIQFLFVLDPSVFSPLQKTFDEAFKFLVSLIDAEMSVLSLKAMATIKMILNASGIFEGCTEQIDIWIYGFTDIHDTENRTQVVKWLLKIIKKANKHIDKYVDDSKRVDDIPVECFKYLGGVEYLFNELMTADSDEETVGANTYFHMQPTVSIPVLLHCAIHRIEMCSHPVILLYLSYVLTYTFHFQVMPSSLICMVRDIPQLPVQKYLLSWLNCNKPIHIREIVPSMKIMNKLSKALLRSTEIQLNDIFTGDDSLIFTYDNKDIKIEYSLCEYDVINLIRMTIFYLTQFVQRERLSDTKASNLKIVILVLLHAAQDMTHRNNLTLIEQCLKNIFTHPMILFHFSPVCQKTDKNKRTMANLIVGICQEVSSFCEKNKAKDLLLPFKNKFLVELTKIIESDLECEQINCTANTIITFELLQLTSEDIKKLFSKLIKLKKKMLLSEDKCNLSVYASIISKLLQISYHNSFNVLNIHSTKQLCFYLIYLKSVDTIIVDDWESNLCNYLSIFPHNIAAIDANTFMSLLKRKMNASTIKLISFLVGRDAKLLSVFTRQMIKSENINNCMIFPIVANNTRLEWNATLLQILWKQCKDNIFSYLRAYESSEIWIRENTKTVDYLILKTFDVHTCKEACDIVESAGDTLEKVPMFYVQTIQTLYNKYVACKSESNQPILDLIQVFLHIITLTLKKEPENFEKMAMLCEGITNAVNQLKKMDDNFVFDLLPNNYSWKQFTRFSLKFGMKKIANKEMQSAILTTLSKLCDIAYTNGSNHEYIKILFEMTTSHSEFVNVMLTSSTTKRSLVQLLLTLVQKNQEVITSKHISLYLAAYNGTLIESDQLILQILQHYENSDIKMDHYRPYLWGNAAALHYSVKGDTDTVLWRQPSTSQVLGLFTKEIIHNTIKNYPIDRALKNSELYKDIEVYDPAFYLPLLSYLLSENNVISCHKVITSGALALIFCACASNRDDMRLAAYSTMSRYYFHLEASRSKEKLLWIRLIDAVRNGITSGASSLDQRPITSLVSTFLARTTLVATQPLHPLYSQLHSFLMAKPALDLSTIPELFNLFHSCDIEYKIHRQWILEIIRDGVNTENDIRVITKGAVLKMLLSFYTCTLSDKRTKELILEVINSIGKITKANSLLIYKYGLLPWLSDVVMQSTILEPKFICLIIDISNKLLDTFPQVKHEQVNYKLMLLKILLKLKPHLVNVVDLSCLIQYISILQRIFTTKFLIHVVSLEDMKDILYICKPTVGVTNEYEDMLHYGCKYVLKRENCTLQTEQAAVCNSLHTLLWTWCRHRTN